MAVLFHGSWNLVGDPPLEPAMSVTTAWTLGCPSRRLPQFPCSCEPWWLPPLSRPEAAAGDLGRQAGAGGPGAGGPGAAGQAGACRGTGYAWSTVDRADPWGHGWSKIGPGNLMAHLLSAPPGRSPETDDRGRGVVTPPCPATREGASRNCGENCQPQVGEYRCRLDDWWSSALPEMEPGGT